MPIVNTDRPMTPRAAEAAVRGLVENFPGARSRILTVTAFGRPVRTLTLGRGKRKVLFTAAHHANEWITAPVILKFVEELARAVRDGKKIAGADGREIVQKTTVVTVPMVNPDGAALVTGELEPGQIQYEAARRMAAFYPQIPFPSGWKANLLGTDLNLNYPALWDQARQIKFAKGYTRPGPRDYVGELPLDQRETAALAALTRQLRPEAVLALHTQGKVIYWQFGDYRIPGAEKLGRRLARVSGYTLAETPYASSFAGYKDWFIQDFRRPGYTVEAGLGENPLPLSQFEEIYRNNLPILVEAALG